MKSSDNPCYGCTERVVGCHSNCEAYHRYQKQLAEEHDKKQTVKNVEDSYCCYYKQKIKALMRAKGERKRK